MYKTFSFGIGLFAWLVAAPAGAHLDLLSPPARLEGQAGNNQLKTKPCGQTANKRTTDKVTTFSPRQQVEIKIKEYINHPGYFAVAFDPDGDDSFIFPRENADKVVAASDDPKALFPVDGLKVLGLRTDQEKDCYTEDASSRECTISITLPNMTCQNCTLQVTQFMYDKLGNGRDDEYYYQCADIKIEGTVVNEGGSGPGGSSGMAGGSGGVPAGGASAGSGGGGVAGAIGGAGGMAGGSGNGGAPTTAGSPSAGSMASGAGTSATSGGMTSAPSNAAGPEESGCGFVARGVGNVTWTSLAMVALLLGLRRRRP